MSSSDSIKADSIIKTHMVIAMGAGLVPIPLLDFVAVTAVQLDMLRQLSNNYGKNFSEQSGKSLVSAIGGSVLARMGASAVKAIPIIGSILGGVTMAVLSGASTYAIGNVFKEHFRNGGDLSNIDIAKAKEFFKVKMEEGKKIAKDLDDKNQQDSPSDNEPKSLVDQLTELAKMKDEGILTDEEFKIMKKKLLDA